MQLLLVLCFATFVSLSTSLWVDGVSHVVNLSLVHSANIKGAVCLDGSLPGYYLDRGHGSGLNSWLVYLEGGGWCFSIKDCFNRSQSGQGSSNYWNQTSSFGGILDNRERENPDFFSWNRVLLKYCDGGSFTGDSQNEAPRLYFRGQRIWLAVIDDLMSKGMQHANQVLLSGCSAGGLSSILHCDQFRELFSSTTTVKCMSDAGLFLDARDILGGHYLRENFEVVVSLQGSKKNLPPSCTALQDPTSCFFPENLIANVKTPLFILNSPYDDWQIRHSLVPPSYDRQGLWKPCKDNLSLCTDLQIQLLQDFRNQMVNALRRFSISKQNGLFINSCLVHCQSVHQERWFAKDSPQLGHKSVARSVADWYFGRAESKAIDCPLPCGRTCVHIK